MAVPSRRAKRSSGTYVKGRREMSNSQERRPAHGARHERSSADSERLSTIHEGQGARVTTRENASEAAGRARHSAEKRYRARHPEAHRAQRGPERSHKNVALLVGAAILGLVLLFFVVRCVTATLTPGPAEQAAQSTDQTQQDATDQTQQDAQDSTNEQAETNASVSYRGSSYALQTQEDGLWGLVRISSDGTSAALFKVEGEPIALMRHDDTILIPENRDGSWDVVCYVIDAHADASYVVGSDGAMVQGSSEATSAQLDDATIHVTDAMGASTDVALA